MRIAGIEIPDNLSTATAYERGLVKGHKAGWDDAIDYIFKSVLPEVRRKTYEEMIKKEKQWARNLNSAKYVKGNLK